MSKTKLQDVRYTPLLDSLVDEFGITTAAVFGRVWRYCQMARGYCHAEHERIADELNISRRTVWGALKVLVREGYLTDATPNTKGRTRIYKDTGKAGLTLLPPAEIGEVTQEVVQSPVQEVVQSPVQILRPKIDKKDKKENTTTSSSRVSEFLRTANQEQVQAFELVRKFASAEKALEKAMQDNPLEAAQDFLEWCADNGGKVAEKVRDELDQQAMEKMYYIHAKDNCNDWFYKFLNDNNLLDIDNHAAFDEWFKSITQPNEYLSRAEIMEILSRPSSEQVVIDNLQKNIEFLKKYESEYADV